MSIPLIVTAGFGNGTLTGTIIGVVLRGYGIGEEIPSVSMSTRFRIEMAPNPRSIELAHEDRAINMPPNQRGVKV